MGLTYALPWVWMMIEFFIVPFVYASIFFITSILSNHT